MDTVFARGYDRRTDSLLAIRAKMIDYGKELMATSADGVRWPFVVPAMTQVLADATRTKNDGKQQVYDYAQGQITQPSILSYAAKLVNRFSVQFHEQWDDTVPLMAVRAVIDAMLSFELTYSVEGADSAHGHAGVGSDIGGLGSAGGILPAITGGTGAGVTISKAASHSGGYTVHIRMILAPGLRLLDAWIEASIQGAGLTGDEAAELWRRTAIGDEHLANILTLTGDDEHTVAMRSWLHREHATAEDILEYSRRLNLPDEDRDLLLRQIGLFHATDQAVALELYDEIPPVTDLLRFAQRNVTVPEVVRDFKLSDEFDRFWQGQLKDGLHNQGISKDWAELYWRAHWVTASPSLAAQALQRLRPNRVDPSIVYTRENYENTLRENDVLPFWRDRMRELAYNVPGVRQIKALYETGQLDWEGVRSAWEDQGYTHDMSVKLANMTQVQGRRDLAQQGHGFTVAEMTKLMEEYVLTETEMRAEMEFLGYTVEQRNDAVLVVARRQRAALKKRQLAALEKGYVGGHLSATDTRSRLVRLDIDANDAQQLLDAWDIERIAHTHVASLAELAKWYTDGLLNAAEYLTRLLQLGYSQTDALRIVQETINAMAAHVAKVRAQQLAATRKALADARKVVAAQAKLAAHNRVVAQRRLVEVVTAQQHHDWETKAADLKEAVYLALDAKKKNPAAHETVDKLHDLLAHLAANERLLEREEKAEQEAPLGGATVVAQSGVKKRRVKQL